MTRTHQTAVALAPAATRACKSESDSEPARVSKRARRRTAAPEHAPLADRSDSPRRWAVRTTRPGPRESPGAPTTAEAKLVLVLARLDAAEARHQATLAASEERQQQTLAALAALAQRNVDIVQRVGGLEDEMDRLLDVVAGRLRHGARACSPSDSGRAPASAASAGESDAASGSESEDGDAGERSRFVAADKTSKCASGDKDAFCRPNVEYNRGSGMIKIRLERLIGWDGETVSYIRRGRSFL